MRDDYEFDDDDAFVVIERQSPGIGSFLIGAAIGAGVAPGSRSHSRLMHQRKIHEQKARTARRR